MKCPLDNDKPMCYYGRETNQDCCTEHGCPSRKVGAIEIVAVQDADNGCTTEIEE